MATNRVLIISFWNPTAENPHQGIFIQDQAAAICRLRENVIFLQVNILPSKRIFLKKTLEESAFYLNKRITVNLYSSLWKFWYVNPWWLARIIYRFIKERGDEINPDIIHSNVIFPCGVVGYLLAKRIGAKTIISEHWSKVEKFLKHPVYKRIAMNAYHKCFAIICVSEFLSHKLAKVTGQINLVVIPNVINTEIFAYLPKSFSDNTRLSFLCVASWRPPKRLDLIFDALCNYANETDRQIDLRIVGNGQQAEALKNRKVPGNFHTEWFGYLNKTAIAALLRSTRVFLHASDIETFSVVTAEALSAGTPVLASKVGALPELINELNGVLAENNPESWLQCIREIVSKQFDYEAISMHNRTRYSPDKIGNSIISIYRKACENQE
jgi:glycosyltransferase involved in cell wall biosynthesis